MHLRMMCGMALVWLGKPLLALGELLIRGGKRLLDRAAAVSGSRPPSRRP